VKAGAIVTGTKPIQTPSLSDDPKEFKTLVGELWAIGDGENVVGKGKVFAGKTLKEVLNIIKVTPDFSYTKPVEDTKLLWVHRKLNDIGFYWVNNRNKRAEDLTATFRENGKCAEIWHPETGNIEKLSYNINGEMTSVPLHLEPNDAVFVVFREKAKEKSFSIPQKAEKSLEVVNGPWEIKFQAGRGAAEQATFDSLSSWNDNKDNGIKYFSGTGIYSKTISISPEWLKQENQIYLDLGSVKNLAEVIVNGKSLGILWKAPFRINITNDVKQGDNRLEIKVTNLWVNRLIGDLQPGVIKKITYTTMPFYKPGSPLQPSGLLGPVQIISCSNN